MDNSIRKPSEDKSELNQSLSVQSGAPDVVQQSMTAAIQGGVAIDLRETLEKSPHTRAGIIDIQEKDLRPDLKERSWAKERNTIQHFAERAASGIAQALEVKEAPPAAPKLVEQPSTDTGKSRWKNFLGAVSEKLKGGRKQAGDMKDRMWKGGGQLAADAHGGIDTGNISRGYRALRDTNKVTRRVEAFGVRGVGATAGFYLGMDSILPFAQRLIPNWYINLGGAVAISALQSIAPRLHRKLRKNSKATSEIQSKFYACMWGESEKIGITTNDVNEEDLSKMIAKAQKENPEYIAQLLVILDRVTAKSSGDTKYENTGLVPDDGLSKKLESLHEKYQTNKLMKLVTLAGTEEIAGIVRPFLDKMKIANQEETASDKTVLTSHNNALSALRNLRFRMLRSEPLKEQANVSEAVREKVFLELMGKHAHCTPTEVPSLGELEQYEQSCFEKFTRTCDRLMDLTTLSPEERTAVDYYTINKGKDRDTPNPKEKMAVLEDRWNISRKYARLLYNTHRRKGFGWNAAVSMGSSLAVMGLTGPPLAPVVSAVTTGVQWWNLRREKPKELGFDADGKLIVSLAHAKKLRGGMYDPDAIDAAQAEHAQGLSDDEKHWTGLMQLPDTLRDEKSIKSAFDLGAMWSLRVLDQLDGKPFPKKKPDETKLKNRKDDLDEAKADLQDAKKRHEDLQKELAACRGKIEAAKFAGGSAKLIEANVKPLGSEEERLMKAINAVDIEIRGKTNIDSLTRKLEKAQNEYRTERDVATDNKFSKTLFLKIVTGGFEPEEMEVPAADADDKKKEEINKENNERQKRNEEGKAMETMLPKLKKAFAVKVNEDWEKVRKKRSAESWLGEETVTVKSLKTLGKWALPTAGFVGLGSGTMATVNLLTGAAFSPMNWGVYAGVLSLPLVFSPVLRFLKGFPWLKLDKVGEACEKHWQFMTSHWGESKKPVEKIEEPKKEEKKEEKK